MSSFIRTRVPRIHPSRALFRTDAETFSVPFRHIFYADTTSSRAERSHTHPFSARVLPFSESARENGKNARDYGKSVRVFRTLAMLMIDDGVSKVLRFGAFFVKEGRKEGKTIHKNPKNESRFVFF